MVKMLRIPTEKVQTIIVPKKVMRCWPFSEPLQNNLCVAILKNQHFALQTPFSNPFGKLLPLTLLS
jgi:hypothetical protein